MHVFVPYYIKATFISPNHNSSVEQKNTQQETNHSNQHSFFRQIVKKNLL